MSHDTIAAMLNRETAFPLSTPQRRQAMEIYPWLEKGLNENPVKYAHIIDAIDTCRPLARVLMKEFGVSRGGLAHMAGTEHLREELRQRPLPRSINPDPLRFSSHYAPGESLFQLARTLGCMAPERFPLDAGEWTALLDTMRWTHGLWALLESDGNHLEDTTCMEQVLAWLSASIWSRIKRRPRAGLSLPPLSAGFLPPIRTWAAAVRLLQPGANYQGQLPGRHGHTLIMPGDRWAALGLLNLHPRDFQHKLMKWGNKIRPQIHAALEPFAECRLPDDIQAILIEGLHHTPPITLHKVTHIGEVLADAKTGNNCLADYVPELAEGKQTLWRIQARNTLVGHILIENRSNRKIRVVDARRLGNKDLPENWRDKIVSILSRQTLLVQQKHRQSAFPFERIIQRTWIKALQEQARTMLHQSWLNFGLAEEIAITPEQIDKAIKTGDLPGAEALVQRLPGKQWRPGLDKHTLTATTVRQKHAWALLGDLPAPEDLPAELVTRFADLLPTRHRAETLAAALLSSVQGIETKAKVFSTRTLSDWQVDALIRLFAEERAKLQSIASDFDRIHLISQVLLNLRFTIGMFFSPLGPEEENQIYRSITAAIRRRTLSSPSPHNLKHKPLSHSLSSPQLLSRPGVAHVLGRVFDIPILRLENDAPVPASPLSPENHT